MLQVYRIPAFQDNYIWLLVNPKTKRGVVVDPGDATPVLATIQENNITLADILITHHHADHTGGIAELLAHTKIPVYGCYREPIQHLSHPLKEQDLLTLTALEITFKILEIPGHTLGHIAYWGDGKLFCGDTLFTGGCGRIFEGTATQMLSSLTKLKNLPDDTLVYCGHEYTEANLRFALTVEPHNQKILQRYNTVKEERSDGKATVPSPLSLELETNPFLRTHIPEVKKAAESYSGTALSNETDIFAVIRNWKNNFSY